VLVALAWSSSLTGFFLVLFSHLSRFLLYPLSGQSFIPLNLRATFDQWASLEYVAVAVVCGLVLGLASSWRALGRVLLQWGRET
jgi:hypothetical protein